VSFVAEFDRLPLASLLRQAREVDTTAVRPSLRQGDLSLAGFARLLSPAAAEFLEPMGQLSAGLTRQRFGRVIRLFAPLYLSNECVNNCRYCGFSRDHPIRRVTLSVAEVVREAEALQARGFRHLLLVAGEHPGFVSQDYLTNCVRALHPEWPSLSLEVAPLATEDYRPLAAAGAEGLVVYQETYDREVYAAMHTAGPKRDFNWRLETPERAYAAGFRRLGISPLYGLADWRAEAICVAAHAQYLLRHCWKAQLTVSTVRLRPCAGEFQPPLPMSDRDLVQLVCALRLFLPDVGLVLSTRESPRLRDGLIPLGVTLISAGSHTEPGGYTGAGADKTHLTRGGRIVAPSLPGPATVPGVTDATGQFLIADDRSPETVSAVLRRLGLEPVWKDWDTALTG
jgi:2-iminoacetate synthase